MAGTFENTGVSKMTNIITNIITNFDIIQKANGNNDLEIIGMICYVAFFGLIAILVAR